MGHTLLIVDDHEGIRKALSLWFQAELPQVKVLEASCAGEALEIIEETSPDVVIMDIGLPGMDGLEATRRIKSGYPCCRVVILTIHEQEQYRQGALGAGADAFVPKSKMQEELLDVIQSLLPPFPTQQR